MSPEPRSHAADEVSMLVVRAAVDGSEACGISRHDILAAAGFDEEALANPDATIPQYREEELWRGIVHCAKDDLPLLGLRAGSSLSRGAFGELEYLGRSSRSVADGLEATACFSRLLHHTDVFQWFEGCLLYMCPHDLADPVAWVASEFALASVLRVLRDAAAADLGRVRLELRHAAWGDVAACEQMLGATLLFSSERSALTLTSEALAVPMKMHDEPLHRILERHARKRSEALPQRNDTAGRVRRVIQRRLGQTSTALEQVAEELGMSGRGLQSRLKDSGAPSLRALLSEARIHAAKHRLRDTDESIISIARRLGYSGTRAFHRAFKQWTGTTPAEYRQHARQIVRH